MIRLLSTYVDLAYRPHGDEPLLFAKKRLLLLSRMPDPAAELARASAEGKAVYVQYQGQTNISQPAGRPFTG